MALTGERLFGIMIERMGNAAALFGKRIAVLCSMYRWSLWNDEKEVASATTDPAAAPSALVQKQKKKRKAPRPFQNALCWLPRPSR